MNKAAIQKVKEGKASIEKKTYYDTKEQDDFVFQLLNEKMKNVNLPMSMEYYGVLDKHWTAAEKAWDRKIKKQTI